MRDAIASSSGLASGTGNGRGLSLPLTFIYAQPSQPTSAKKAHLQATVGPRRRNSLLTALCTSLLVLLGLLATPAQAIVTHSLTSTFGLGLSFPYGIAVDNSSTGAPGEVYVADIGNDRVAKFKADGTADGKIDSSNITGANCTGAQGFSGPAFVATDPSNGDLYVSDRSATTITAFDASGHCLFQINPSNTMPAGVYPYGIAIDPSTGPNGADGTIYLANLNGSQIEEFDATTHAHTGSFPVSSINQLNGLALDSAGHLYVTDWRYPANGLDPSHGQITEYDPSAGGALVGTVDTTNAQAVGIDLVNNQVFVVENGPDIYDTGCCGNNGHSAYVQVADFRSPDDSSPTLIFGKGDIQVGPEFGSGAQGSFGIAVNDATDTVYVADPKGSQIRAYGPSVVIPDAITGQALSSDHSSATLHGHLDPDTADAGTAITSCYFQYGTDTTYSGAGSGTAPCTPDPASNPPSSNFTGPTDVTVSLQNLQTLTTYHYRLVATSANNVPAYGLDRTVTPLPNLPTIDATSPSAVTQTTATIDTQINPGFGPTVYRVEYGANTSYGSSSVISDSIGADGVDHSVSAQLSDLTPATTYHYRVRAINYSGVTLGSDHAFNTIDLPAVSDTSSAAVTSTSATLTAQLSPNFSPTTYHFDYGVGTGYGSSTPESASIGSDHSVHAAGADISGLVPATTYHYRVVATNAAGASDGPDQTFTTAAASTIAPPPPPITCKHGFVKRNGKCVRRHHPRKHHKRSASHG